MKYSIYLFIAILAISCESRKSPKKENPETANSSFEGADIDKALDSLYQKGVFNGFSASIVDSSGILYNKGFGYANLREKKKYTKNTLINIASISKVFIGIALLKAQEMGHLELDDPINKHLPFEVLNPNFPKEDISIRQLATHSSSIVDGDVYIQSCYINQDDVSIDEKLKEKYGLYYQNPSTEWIPLAAYMKKLLKTDESLYDPSSFANRKPGALYEYSNIGAALCALIIEYATKTAFHEFTQQHIFAPLEMTATTWQFEEADSNNYSKLYFEQEELPYYKILSYPDGGLITSSTDLSKFLIELIKAYSGKGSILNPSSYKEFFKSQLNETALGDKKNSNIGISIDKQLGYHVIGHSGGDPGTNTMMYFDTEKGSGRIFIANTDSHKENSDEVFWNIWDTLDQP